MARGGGCIPEPEIVVDCPFGNTGLGSTDQIYVLQPDPELRRSDVVEGYNEGAELPEEAVDTGLRKDGKELWSVPSNDRSVFVVEGDSVIQVPLDPNPPGCD